MTFDPYKQESGFEKSRDDWWPVNNKRPATKKHLLILLPTRQYKKIKGVIRRVKQQPDLPKRCMVECCGIPMHYLLEEKRLCASGAVGEREYPPTIFPSKVQAKKAIWHTVAKSGIPNSHVDYRIVYEW